MEFEILKQSKKSRARIGKIKTSHGELITPAFLPVATQGIVKTLSSEEIKEIPAVAVPDLYRALQKVPGVTFTSEASPEMNVRGGNFDQNLVMLDGAVIYYPFHFLGITSSFNIEMIDDIDFSLGGFSARFGDRLSSVLNIHTKKPQHHFPRRLNLSLIGGDLTTGGKVKNSFGWIFSGRTSYFDLVNKFVKEKVPYTFYDGILKLEFQPDRNQCFELIFFKNNDRVYLNDKTNGYLKSSTDASTMKYKIMERSNFHWSNSVVSLKWNILLTDRLNFQFQAYTSEFQNLFQNNKSAEFPKNLDEKFLQDKQIVDKEIIENNVQSGATIKNRFRDWTIKSSVSWNITNSVRFYSGCQFTQFGTRYGWQELYDIGEVE